MLTIGRREDGRKGLGSEFAVERGGAMEVDDNELEEGEACSSQDDDSCIDPDSLSYIDKKIQDVLGHFQKEFEGGVSVENLGAKYGGYGSFLPTYQRSPNLISQPRISPKLAHHNVAQSPYNPSFEGTRQTTSLTASTSNFRSNTIMAQKLDNSAKKDICISTNNRESISHHNTYNKPANGNDPSSLKVRLKVGPENNFLRDNAAIYTGLGLDMSPSSSYENSPDGSRGISPEFHCLNDESPKTIIQVMTCFTIPGGFLLSPLQDSLLQLMQKNDSFLKKYKGHEGISENGMILAQLSLPVFKNDAPMAKKIKQDERKGRLMELQDSQGKVAIRKLDIEVPEGQEFVSKSCKVPEFSVSRSDDEEAERLIVGHAVKSATKIWDNVGASNFASVNNRITSPDLATNKQPGIAENIKSEEPVSADTARHSREKLISKSSKTVKMSRALTTDSQMNDYSCPRRDGSSKFEKDFGLSKMNSQSSGQKGRNNGSFEPSTLKNISTELDALHDIDGTKPSQLKDHSSNRKRKAKAGHNTTEPLTDLSKDSCSGNSSAAFREQNKCTYTTSHNAEKKVKGSKLHKESDGINFRPSCKGDQVKQLECSLGSLKPKQKVVKHNPGKELPVSSQNFKEKSSSKRAEGTLNSGAFINEQTPAALISNVPDTVAAVTAPAPIVIEENWVCCDLCQKWRLLPYGTNPNSLPKKWQCRLLDWLPGMNSCHFSEDETTKALNALYMAPAPEYHNGTGALQFGQTIELGTHNMHATGKKKSFPKDVPSLLSHSTLAETPNSSKKNYQAPMNYTSLSDANHYAHETKSLSKIGPGNLKSINIGAEKPKQKQKKHKSNVACYSDGGDLTDKNMKYPNSRGEREFHQDDLRGYKNSKKENILNSSKDWHSNDTPTEKFFDEGTVGCLTSAKVTLSNQPRDDNFHLAKDSNSNLNAMFSTSSKKSLKHADMKEHIIGHDAEISANQVISKKRKVSDWQESRGNKETKVTDQNMAARVISEGYLSGNDQAKDKKAKVSKSQGKCSGLNKIEGKTGKKGSKIRTILPVSGDFLPDVVHRDVQYDLRKEDELTQCKGTDNFQRGLDFDYLKRDLSYPDAAAANSSTSKVSGSHRIKACHQDAKGSPVESVSSSPFRMCNMDTLSHKKQAVQKDYAINGSSSARDIGKRYSDTETDGDIDRCSKGRKGLAFEEKERCYGNSREGNEPLMDEFGDVYVVGNNRNAANHQGKHLQEGPKKNDIQVFESLSKHHSSVKSSKQKSGKSSSRSRERGIIYKSDFELGNHKVSSFFRDKKDLNSVKNDIHSHCEKDINTSEPSTLPEPLGNQNWKVQNKKIEDTSLGKKYSTSSWLTARQIDNLALAAQENKDAGNASAFPSQSKDIGLLVPVAGDRFIKENIQDHSSADRGNRSELPSAPGRSQLNMLAEDKSSMASSALKLSRSDIYVVEAVTGESAKAVKQLRQPDVQNVLHHNNLRHTVPNGTDASSPIRKDVHLATSAVMREARDLKHTANRLKNEGLELESTGLYFEAALKFLHVASLMEPLNFDNTKQDAAQMYSDTAKLCQYVAHEYEKLKDMAAAALAYKCVEVAYLKAAYYKNPNVSKDRHDVQTALQTLPPGESPSSSASDVDNVNNQATISKIASVKGVSSPQVPSSNIIAARLHPQVLRLLQYTNDMNSAFEATRKSQGAISAASVSMKRDNMDGLSSVREVLDFSFHNVEGLLRLLRLSKESISR